MKKSIVFINQSSGYLMIDIINAHLPYYEEIVLFTGFLNPRETPLHKKVKVIKGVSYNRSYSFLRLMSWFIFWLQSLFYIFFRYRRHKIYFISNPPLNIFSARFVKRDFAFLVYDVYPQALHEYNYLKRHTFFFKYWEKTNRIVFNKAKRLFTISEGMSNAIANYGIKNKRIEIIPLWTSNAFFQKTSGLKNEFANKIDIEGKFIIGYSGNLGMSHPIEKLVEVAQILRHHEDIIFLIIGEGDKKELLKRKKKELCLDNLKVLNYQPTQLFPQVLASFHIGVITLDKIASHLNVPSKTYNMMSAGKPVLSISSDSSELSKIIDIYGIGKNFHEDQIEDMVEFILTLKNDVQLYNKFKMLSKKASLDFSSENAKKLVL